MRCRRPWIAARPLACGAMLALAARAPAQHEWTQFAGGPSRPGAALIAAPSIAAPAWTRSSDAAGNPIAFSGASGVAVSLDRVYAVGSVTPAGQATQHRVFAIDRRTGALAWSSAVPAPALGSWSTPAYDAAHRSVLVASGTAVTALDAATGATVWQAGLSHPVVNASPAVTNGWGAYGLGMANRCLVTEFDGFGDDGRLTCINIDAHDPAANPFQPGQVVWSVPIGGSSGNSPAVWNGRVFVCTAGLYGEGPGRVLCFDARSTTAPEPVWQAQEPGGEAFFGGVCVRPRPGGADLYCASYAFFGGRGSSSLLKVDALTGQIRWSAPCNRTSATPVVLPDGRIAVSGGLAGYGTVPTLQLFRDHGAGATLLWDSSAATWNDSNANGVMDLGEFLVLGGWSHQPLLTARGSPRLLVGSLATGLAENGACTDLYAIDIAKLPTSPGAALPGYLAQHYAGAGSTPAGADANVYCLGPQGLVAFGPAPPRFDVDSNGVIDIGDLYAWEQGAGLRDVDLDGQVTQADRAALLAELRAGELEDMRAGRTP